MSHTTSSMFALPTATNNLFNMLPKEFTKKEFDAARASMKNARPLSLSTCREYGFVVLVRTEPTTYKTKEGVWVNPVTNERYTENELERKWSIELAEQFGVAYTPTPQVWRLPYSLVEVEKPCVRNIFTVNLEKFQKFLDGTY